MVQSDVVHVIESLAIHPLDKEAILPTWIYFTMATFSTLLLGGACDYNSTWVGLLCLAESMSRVHVQALHAR